MIGYQHTKHGVPLSPQLREPLAHWVPQRVKVENFLYILLSSGPRLAGARQYYTSSGASGCAHKISTDIRLTLPPLFYKGAEYPKFWPKLPPKSSSDCRSFGLRQYIGNQKQTSQRPMMGLSTHQTRCSSVPPTPRTLGAIGAPKW